MVEIYRLIITELVWYQILVFLLPTDGIAFSLETNFSFFCYCNNAIMSK